MNRRVLLQVLCEDDNKGENKIQKGFGIYNL